MKVALTYFKPICLCLAYKRRWPCQGQNTYFINTSMSDDRCI